MTYGNGDDGARTHDLRIANATLSQLSYVPMLASSSALAESLLSLSLSVSVKEAENNHPRRPFASADPLPIPARPAGPTLDQARSIPLRRDLSLSA